MINIIRPAEKMTTPKPLRSGRLTVEDSSGFLDLGGLEKPWLRQRGTNANLKGLRGLRVFGSDQSAGAGECGSQGFCRKKDLCDREVP